MGFLFVDDNPLDDVVGFGGRELGERRVRLPVFFNALSEMTEVRMVPEPCGVLIAEPDGALLWAVGVSGVTSDNGESCVRAAIPAAGSMSKTGT